MRPQLPWWWQPSACDPALQPLSDDLTLLPAPGPLYETVQPPCDLEWLVAWKLQPRKYWTLLAHWKRMLAPGTPDLIERMYESEYLLP